MLYLKQISLQNDCLLFSTSMYIEGSRPLKYYKKYFKKSRRINKRSIYGNYANVIKTYVFQGTDSLINNLKNTGDNFDAHFIYRRLRESYDFCINAKQHD